MFVCLKNFIEKGELCVRVKVLKGDNMDSAGKEPACAVSVVENKHGYLTISWQPSLLEHRNLFIAKAFKCLSANLPCISVLRIPPGLLRMLIQAINVILKLKHLLLRAFSLPCKCLRHY